MGIYLGQLPPAEIARLKAELAETLIAHFCYPRFFDARSQSLRIRPVDRARRQEVWLFLSSVDFTQWSRIDLMAPELQYQIERLFIQFVQRNRSFFGEQGRKRMSDVRTLLNSSAQGVAQGLRNYITGQRQQHPPFGSPRPVVSWAGAALNGRAEATWGQVAGTTMLLQQQLQELRGEIKNEKPAAPSDGRLMVTPHRPVRPQSSNGTAEKVTAPTTPPSSPVQFPQRTGQVTPIPDGPQVVRTITPLSDPKVAKEAPARTPAASASYAGQTTLTPHGPAPATRSSGTLNS